MNLILVVIFLFQSHHDAITDFLLGRNLLDLLKRCHAQSRLVWLNLQSTLTTRHIKKMGKLLIKDRDGILFVIIIIIFFLLLIFFSSILNFILFILLIFLFV